jgi:hypothetical protein
MHTSYLTLSLFLGGVSIAVLAQWLNYASIPREQRTCSRKFALGLMIIALLLSATAAYQAAVDWSALPESSKGLRSGQLWNDGGIPAVVR